MGNISIAAKISIVAVRFAVSFLIDCKSFFVNRLALWVWEKVDLALESLRTGSIVVSHLCTYRTEDAAWEGGRP